MPDPGKQDRTARTVAFFVGILALAAVTLVVLTGARLRGSIESLSLPDLL
jgi:hypothetical protein